MEAYESEYSEDFEEEEVNSTAIHSSKPSDGGTSLSRKRREQSGAARLTRDRRWDYDDQYITPNRPPIHANSTATTSKSTGAVKKDWRERAKPNRCTQSFLPQKLQRSTKITSNSSPARDRQLSAMNHTLHGLQNKLAEKTRELEEIAKENKLLTRLQRKQDKEWTKIQRQENELPQILQRHEQEVRALRKQLRKSHQEVMNGQQKVSELQDEVRHLQESNRKLERVAGKKMLLERNKLTEKLQELSSVMADKDRRIAELERGMVAGSKTHAQERRGLRLRNKALADEATSLRETAHRLHTQLKDKMKEMDVMNIYTQRIPCSTVTKPPPSPPSHPSIIHQSSQTTLSCPPFKSVSLQHRSHLKATSSQTETVKPIPKTDSTTQTSYLGNQVTIATSTTSGSVQTSRVPASSVEGEGKQVSVEEKSITTTTVQRNDAQAIEETSKQTLLQKLRELDAQKTAPGSKPLTSSPSIANTKQLKVIQSPPSTMNDATSLVHNTKPSRSQDDVAREKQERKRLLLAKLMAIDEGSDPNQLKSSVATQPKGSQKAQKSHSQTSQPASSLNASPRHQADQLISQHAVSSNRISSNKSNTSSTSSWSEVVDNMHHGRPAHASNDDPFGSRSRLNSLKKTKTKKEEGVSVREKAFITESGNDLRQGLSLKQAGLEEEKQRGSDGDGEYKPSFGRRAQNVEQSITRHINIHAPPPLPWLQGSAVENKTSSPTNTHLGGLSPSSSSRSQLLPRRPKVDTTAMRSNDVMPGAIISDPDDLEELVL